MASAPIVAPVVAPVVSTTAPAADHVVAPAVVPPAPPIPGEDIATQYKKLQEAHQLKTREYVTERRKWEAANKANAEKLTKLSEYEKTQKAALRNPTEYLKGIYGDGWYEKIIDAKINGVPPAELMAQEMEKMEQRFEEKFSKRDAEAAKAREAQETQQVERARNGLNSEANEFVKANAKDYPIFERFGTPENTAAIIAQRIETEFNKTLKLDEAGNVLQQGNVLTTKEAADLLEGELLEIAATAFKHDKYKGKFVPPAAVVAAPVVPVKPTVVSSVASKAGSTLAKARRTLSNEITGHTSSLQDNSKAKTDAERRARANAKYEELRSKK